MTGVQVRLLEAEWQQQVTELAELLGWEWMWVRPMRTKYGWKTGTTGTMAKGWPDLAMVRGDRLIFVELKRDGEKVSDEQARVLELLGAAVEVFVWTPSDFETVHRVLR